MKKVSVFLERVTAFREKVSNISGEGTSAFGECISRCDDIRAPEVESRPRVRYAEQDTRRTRLRPGARYRGVYCEQKCQP